MNLAENINLATKNALLNVIDHLVHERGFTRLQAYVIASVGVDVTVDGIAAVPNTVVSAVLRTTSSSDPLQRIGDDR